MRGNKRFRLIARFLGGKKSKQFENLTKKIESDSEFAKDISQMKTIWEHDANLIEPTSADEMWKDFQRRLHYKENAARQALYQHARNRRASRRSFVYAFAVILLLIVPASLYFYSNVLTTEQTVQYSEIRVPNGQRHTLQLNDGTRIVLDSGSYLRYPETFADERVVHLKGEAYFEVAHNPRKPFIVNANQAHVQVLGTTFNIRAWESSHTVKVAVKEGLVSLRHADSSDAKTVFIKKNQFSILEENSPTDPQNTDINQHLSWMQNEILLDSASVSQVFEQLRRWYDYDFVVADSSILQQKVTVHILNTNVNDVLQIMGRLTGTHVEREGNEIRFIEK